MLSLCKYGFCYVITSRNCKFNQLYVDGTWRAEVADAQDAYLYIRYTDAREWTVKHMESLGAYYLRNISVDPMCCSK